MRGGFEVPAIVRDAETFSRSIGNMTLSSGASARLGKIPGTNATPEEVYYIYDDKVLAIEMFFKKDKGRGSIVDAVTTKFGKPTSDVITTRRATKSDASLAVTDSRYEVVQVESQALDRVRTVEWKANTPRGDSLLVVLSIVTKSGVVQQQMARTGSGQWIQPSHRQDPKQTTYSRTFAHLSVKNTSLGKQLKSRREELRSDLEEEVRKAIAEDVRRDRAEEQKNKNSKPEL